MPDIVINKPDLQKEFKDYLKNLTVMDENDLYTNYFRKEYEKQSLDKTPSSETATS